MTTPAFPSYTGHRFPAEVISHAVWLYFRFPLSLRMVEEMLAARGIIVSHESVRQWARKFGQDFANRVRRRLPAAGDKRHLDEVVLKIAGKKHWLWRAVDQDGIVLDILVQSRRNKRAAKRELSPNVGDGLTGQAAAIWDFEDAGLPATSIPSVNLTP
jgi:putative transposase